MAKRQFADIIDEVVLNFTREAGRKSADLDRIDAREQKRASGDGLQRAVRENCNVLRFKNAEFDWARSLNSIDARERAVDQFGDNCVLLRFAPGRTSASRH